MSNAIVKTGLLLGLLMPLNVVADTIDQDNIIRLATLGPGVGNFAPVLYFENQQLMGTMPDQIRCAFSALGYQIRFIAVPIGRHVMAVENQQADGYFPASSYEYGIQPEQTSIVLLETSIAMYSLRPVSLDSNPPPSVAIVRLSMAPESVVKHYQLPVVRVSRFSQTIELLLKKRVDAVISNDQAFELTIKNNDYDFTWVKQALKPVQLRLYLSPRYTDQHKEIFTRINPELAKCKAQAQNNR